jgi:ABC-type polysaccharide/polyol phosphate export permease
MEAHYGPVIADIQTGAFNWRMWGRLGWRETKRRYRRTSIGPFWNTMSLAIFVVVLGIVWSQLFHQNPKEYLPYLASGMVTWILFSTILMEGCSSFIAAEGLIKQLRISYTVLACTNVWRNLIIFGHNLFIYVPVCVYAEIPLTWSTLLVIPGLVLLCLNGVWISLVLGLCVARFRDIQPLVASLLQVAMFVTPIMWTPAQLAGSGRIALIAKYNLLFHYVELVRRPLLGEAPEALSYLAVVSATLLGWGLMLFLFGRFQRRIPYWL